MDRCAERGLHWDDLVDSFEISGSKISMDSKNFCDGAQPLETAMIEELHDANLCHISSGWSTQISH